VRKRNGTLKDYRASSLIGSGVKCDRERQLQRFPAGRSTCKTPDELLGSSLKTAVASHQLICPITKLLLFDSRCSACEVSTKCELWRLLSALQPHLVVCGVPHTQRRQRQTSATKTGDRQRHILGKQAWLSGPFTPLGPTCILSPRPALGQRSAYPILSARLHSATWRRC
jgi:hypothetical protein